TSFSVSKWSRRSPSTCTTRTIPHPCNSRKLVLTFERATSSVIEISSAGRGFSARYNSACTCATVRLIPHFVPISPQCKINFSATGGKPAFPASRISSPFLALSFRPRPDRPVDSGGLPAKYTFKLVSVKAFASSALSRLRFFSCPPSPAYGSPSPQQLHPTLETQTEIRSSTAARAPPSGSSRSVRSRYGARKLQLPASTHALEVQI